MEHLRWRHWTTLFGCSLRVGRLTTVGLFVVGSDNMQSIFISCSSVGVKQARISWLCNVL